MNSSLNISCNTGGGGRWGQKPIAATTNAPPHCTPPETKIGDLDEKNNLNFVLTMRFVLSVFDQAFDPH